MGRWGRLSALLILLNACSAAETGEPEHDYIPVPGCEKFDYAPCDTLELECQTSRLALAACLRGSEAGELPPVMLVTETEYAENLSAEIAAKTPRPNPDHWERAFSMLGLVEKGAFQPSAVVMDQVKQIWGFYDFNRQSITLIDHGSPAADARSNVVLLHELMHALQDREEKLASYTDERIFSYESYWAISSVYEGEARLHEDRYAASLSGLDPARVDWQDLFARRIAKVDGSVVQQPSPLLASIAFSYAYGERLASFAWQSGGHDAVRALFDHPPESTWVLMASTEDRRDAPVVVEPVSPTPPEGWLLEDYEMLGAWGLMLGLSSDIAQPLHDEALGWRGDKVSVYSGASTPAETAVVWQIEMDSEAAATAVARRLANSARSFRVERNGARVIAAVATAPVSLDWAFVAP